jgi:hypothetical protein
MDPYLTLGVPRGCTRQEAKDAFRAGAWRAHPDRGGDERTFIRLYAAYKRILRELEQTTANTSARSSPSANSSTTSDLPDAVSDDEIVVIEMPPPVPRRPTLPDPAWDPELVMCDLPRPNPMPFDPQWNPELVVGDEASRAPPAPRSARGTRPYSSMPLTTKNPVPGPKWKLPRLIVRAARLAALILLFLYIIALAAIWWRMPEN